MAESVRPDRYLIVSGGFLTGEEHPTQEEAERAVKRENDALERYGATLRCYWVRRRG